MPDGFVVPVPIVMKVTETGAGVGVGVGVGVFVGEGVGVAARGTGAVFAGGTELAPASNKLIRTNAIMPMHNFLKNSDSTTIFPKKN